ncbi:glycosyltransferase family protein [Sedimentitalea sp. XS_ASV28]|uniref:glycosyltransferase family protein n=1 Tax=Sedimentitalea sp. XS_ASV28 TaxID=3241296 RepID=UPI0035153F3F
MKVMIVVTHLLGSGHLRRALVLADAFATAGNRVVLVSGGMPLDIAVPTGVRILQLPPLRSDGVNFSRLLTETGEPADETLMTARAALLCNTVGDFKPDVLMTELFPFGRRVLSAEFLALLQTADTLQARPVILSSVRDILAPPSKPSKAERTAHVIADHYDAVLVHSDPGITPLEQSWPVGDAIRARLQYTGYVTQPAPQPHPDGVGTGEILVSAGGGEVGTSIFETALAAARQMPGMRWRLLVAGPAERVASLRRQAIGGHVIVEPLRPDFRNLLANATASVSMCGYNTAMDVLQTGIPAVFIPFDAGNEVEQALRANSLSGLPGIATVRERDLTAETLCAAICEVTGAPHRAQGGLEFDGAARSVAIATEMLEARG